MQQSVFIRVFSKTNISWRNKDLYILTFIHFRWIAYIDFFPSCWFVSRNLQGHLRIKTYKMLLSLETFCPRFFQKCCCHSCGNRTLYWHINVRNYYIHKGACKYIVQCHVQCHVSDFLGQMISQPNSTLQCVKKSCRSLVGKDQSISQKLQKKAYNKLKTHSKKSRTLYVHCTESSMEKKLSAWAVLEPRPLAL